MKLRGGYLPKIAGRPSASVASAPVPSTLSLDLQQGTVVFQPVVDDGATVRFGDVLAESESAGGTVALPAPASGTVSVERDSTGSAFRLLLSVSDAVPGPCAVTTTPERTTAESLRSALARSGIWPLIWSSGTGGMPPLDGSEEPRRIVVNCVLVEPYRARGKVLLREERQRITVGLTYLQRLLAEYGVIHMVLTKLSDPMAVSIREELAGSAWVRVEDVPLRYPVESPRVLCRSLRAQPGVSASETVWLMDIQTVAAIGACLGEGLPLHERILAVGGPGEASPRHIRARVGTPLADLLDPETDRDNSLVLRGGLFTGEPIDGTQDGVRLHDDGVFVLPRPREREFLSFVRAGFDRVSYTPCFATALTRGADRSLSTSLRGELRPCIGCGNCEAVCPVGLLPQVLHRYLYRDAIDQAEAAGLPRCLLCGLCTYVCPSKIELQSQFAEMQERLHAEHEAQARAEADRRHREEAKKSEAEHSEDWRK